MLYRKYIGSTTLDYCYCHSCWKAARFVYFWLLINDVVLSHGCAVSLLCWSGIGRLWFLPQATDRISNAWARKVELHEAEVCDTSQAEHANACGPCSALGKRKTCRVRRCVRAQHACACRSHVLCTMRWAWGRRLTHTVCSCGNMSGARG